VSWDKAEQEIMQSIKKTVENVDQTLNGDPKDVESTGLVGQVQENTRFRLGITKKINAVWVILTGVGTKIGYDLYEMFKIKGGN